MHPQLSPSRPDVASELDRFTRACHERGVPVTHQRLAVYRALLASREHPSAEGVFREIKPELPALSLGTVYKTIDFLVDLGFVREVDAPGTSRRFDANLGAHHHLWCVRCHTLEDVAHEAFEGVRAPDGLDFAVSDYTIRFNGICAACRAKGDAS